MASSGGTEISRRIASINAEIKSLTTSCRNTAQVAKNLGDALKIDPSNTRIQTQYMNALRQSVQQTTDKMNLLVSEQKRLESEGIDDSNRKRYEQLGVQISQCEANLVKFNNELDTSNTKGKKTGTTLTDSFKKVSSSISSAVGTMAKTIAGVTASIMGIGVAFASTADQIDIAVNKFGGTAEQWQVQSFIWDRLTGSADAYEQVLTAINTNLGQVQKESSRVGTVLAQLGLTFDDLKGKTSSEALQIYLQALSTIGDEAQRQAIAVSLFGETVGVYLAQMLNASSSEINEWTQAAQNAGIMTNEQVEAGAELQDTLDDLMKTIKSMIATLGTSFMPLIQTIVTIVQSLAPLINGVASALNALGPVGTTVILMVAALVAGIVKLVISLVSLHMASLNIPAITAGVAALGLLATAGIATAVALNTGSNGSSGSYVAESVDEMASNAATISSGNNESSNSGNTQNITYNDYSTVNQDISSEVDYDEFAKYMSNKKRQIIGG